MSDIAIQHSAEPSRPSVGQILKSTREARALTLENAAEKLKLTTRQLLAIERDDYQALPGNLFVRGFVRNYARLLELDPQPLLERLAAALPQERAQAALPYVGDATALNTAVYLTRTGPGWPIWLVSILGFLLGIGAVIWYLRQPAAPDVAAGAASAPVASAPAPEAVMMPDPVSASSAVVLDFQQPVSEVASSVAVQPARASAVAPAAASTATQAASAPAIAQEGAVRVQVDFDSWVQISDAQGQILLSQLLRPGNERSVTGKPPYRVKIGNASKTRLYYRGQPVDLAPYLQGDVATLELK